MYVSVIFHGSLSCMAVVVGSGIVGEADTFFVPGLVVVAYFVKCVRYAKGILHHPRSIRQLF